MSELTGFVGCCLRGLERMHVPAESLFSFSYRDAGAPGMVQVRSPSKELKFTMNVLLGLGRSAAAGRELFPRLEEDYGRLAAREPCGLGRDDHVETLASIVWTGRALGLKVPGETLSRLRRAMDEPLAAPLAAPISAQALAWGILASLDAREEETARALALARLAEDHYVHPVTGLVRHLPSGPRRDWASFAASSYMAYAFLRLGRASGETGVRDAGLRIARELAARQGPLGQWGWWYHVPSGRTADYYPVYSVHQHAMAPLFLLEAMDLGYEEFREPLLRGFRWILGDNELESGMVDARAGVVWRCAERRGPRGTAGRFLRLARTALRRSSGLTRGTGLRVNRECRSYELGWGLLAFGGRGGLEEILDDARFA